MQTNRQFKKSYFIIILYLMSLLACSGGRPPSVNSNIQPSSVNSMFTQQALNKLMEADIILIGETHDHPQHHQIQAELIKKLKPQTVAFEMLNTDQQQALDQLETKPPSDWDNWLAWSQRGWPDFELYQPVFEAAIRVKAKLLAAHPHPSVLAPLKIGAELPSKLKEQLKLDAPLPDEQEAIMEEEIKVAHCGHASPPIVEAMIKAQRLKDSWMANQLLQSTGKRVLIVGRGHIHPQRGIPWAIKQLDPDSSLKVAIISLAEQVSKDIDDSTVFKHLHLKVKAHRHDDPCERFKEQLKKLKQHHGQHK